MCVVFALDHECLFHIALSRWTPHCLKSCNMAKNCGFPDLSYHCDNPVISMKFY